MKRVAECYCRLSGQLFSLASDLAPFLALQSILGFILLGRVLGNPRTIWLPWQCLLSGGGASLPGTPTMGPVTVGIGTIFRYTLEAGPDYDPKELHTLQNFLVKRQLKTVPGVADVITFGGLSKEYQVQIDPDRLEKFGLSVQQVFEAVGANNANVGAGVLEQDAEAYLVRGIGLLKNEADIGNIAVSTRSGTPIRVRDVASVVIGSTPQVGTLSKNGTPIELTSGVVLQRKGESTRAVMDRVQQKLEEVRRSLPPGVKLVTYYDQTELIGKTIHTVATSLIEGGVLVVIVLVVFLGNLRVELAQKFQNHWQLLSLADSFLREF
ncbi:MAG: efflux RND transporter permease subunit [Anaerolineae bacterium]|nr:efflux RND transporter permease subunit [Gloeobacterales cyanobacterium ES-bin-313]